MQVRVAASRPWSGLNQGRYSGAVRRGCWQWKLDVATLEQ
jgi:hypothetical protein